MQSNTDAVRITDYFELTGVIDGDLHFSPQELAKLADQFCALSLEIYFCLGIRKMLFVCKTALMMMCIQKQIFLGSNETTLIVPRT